MSKKLAKIKKQIKNCRQVLAMLASLPNENLNLMSFRCVRNIRGDYIGNNNAPPNCETVACVGGWLPYWPYFAKMGIVSATGSIKYPILPSMKGSSNSGDQTDRLSKKLFGDPCMLWLYNPRDNITNVSSTDCSDHGRAIRRFTNLISDLEARAIKLRN